MDSTIPPFEDIIHDLDSLYKVNRIGNSLDIVNDFTFKAPTAQEVIGKIEKMAKLVQGGQVTIRDLLMAGAIRDNISPGSQIALVNTMAQKDLEGERVRFTEFKSAFRQTFVATPPPQILFSARIRIRLITETTIGIKEADLALRSVDRGLEPEGGTTSHRRGTVLHHQGLSTTTPGQVTLILASTARVPGKHIS